ncbi:MAG: hypothetical protein DBX47_00035 [Clostridiales bacterium]|nr:MAG: hypothetical protein DBX47_00035 [Clostridiales bacterium]
MKITVCIGSSCHLKGSYKILDMLKKEIQERNLENDIVLSGNFCIGKCNRVGVTLQVDDKIFTGITCENLETFFQENVLEFIEQERK